MTAMKVNRSGEFSSLPRIGRDGRSGGQDAVGDDTADALGDSWSEVKSAPLRLERWHKQTDVGNKLVKLDLANCNMMGNLAPSVAELYNRQKHNVKQVLLRDNPGLGPEALKYLVVAFENSKSLQSLNLRNTGLTDECISSLIKSFHAIPKLADLNMSSNTITESGAELFASFLEKNSTLTSLSLAANKLRDVGAQRVAHALETNTTLQCLDLAGCRIADTGAVQMGLALAVNATLTKLDMCRNPITEDGVDAISEVIQKNLSLLQVSLTGVEKIYLERISQVCRRNRTLVGDLVPHKLDKEMQRLYVQQHKLEVANQHLRDLHMETSRIQEQAKNIDSEVEMEKQEITAKAKKVVEVIDFATLSIQELQRKYKELQAQAQREKDAKEAEIESLTEKLDAVTRERELLEARAEEQQVQQQRLAEERQARVDEINRKIESCRKEQQVYAEQKKVTLEKFAEVSTMVQQRS
eukprot:GGOE01061947.1.p1 GENE.GGOE01061947.1~~GGOE01061947.1.p1  ORF type:complete len:469 (-),score=157.33 GGOE01061947.1:186-1592(-)